MRYEQRNLDRGRERHCEGGGDVVVQKKSIMEDIKSLLIDWKDALNTNACPSRRKLRKIGNISELTAKRLIETWKGQGRLDLVLFFRDVGRYDGNRRSFFRSRCDKRMQAYSKGWKILTDPQSGDISR